MVLRACIPSIEFIIPMCTPVSKVLIGDVNRGVVVLFRREGRGLAVNRYMLIGRRTARTISISTLVVQRVTLVFVSRVCYEGVLNAFDEQFIAGRKTNNVWEKRSNGRQRQHDRSHDRSQ